MQQKFTIQVTNPRAHTATSFYGTFGSLGAAISSLAKIRKAAVLDPGSQLAAVPLPDGITPKHLNKKYL